MLGADAAQRKQGIQQTAADMEASDEIVARGQASMKEFGKSEFAQKNKMRLQSLGNKLFGKSDKA